MYGIMLKDKDGWHRLMDKYFEVDQAKSKVFETESLDELKERYNQLLDTHGKSDIMPIQDLTVDINVDIKDELGGETSNSESDEIL